MINFISNQVRRSYLKLFYENKDITQDVSRYIESFSFTERAKNGESDELTLTLLNRDGEWCNAWFPYRGAKIQAFIYTQSWNQVNDSYTLDCGTFEIDDITDSGPPNIVSLSALSIGITSSIRGQANSKAWENFKLSKIVDEIAAKHGFNVFFDSEYDPVIDRFDQKNESDLAFLLKVAEYIGVNIRMSKNKLIVYQDVLYDSKEASFTARKNQDGYINHSIRASSADIYKACHVQYLDSLSGNFLTYQYSIDGRSGTLGKKSSSGGDTKIDEKTRMVISKPSTESVIEAPAVGKVLKINRRCKNLVEAQQLAKNKLRNKNEREFTGSLSFVGNLYLRAGLTIVLSGFGVWDSVMWVIDEVNHSWSVSSGLETSITIRGGLTY